MGRALALQRANLRRAVRLLAGEVGVGLGEQRARRLGDWHWTAGQPSAMGREGRVLLEGATRGRRELALWFRGTTDVEASVDSDTNATSQPMACQRTYRESCWPSAWLWRGRSWGARLSSWGDGVSVAVDWWL
ncbi:hypothetical protein EYF80_037042 [Liparis tanakae]|uniref:Uncharacterized protein n=1 Tax=Liparis tanakae TaxID=230148 RepID=A0A4Z2GGS0_9TELE|nr:hypothetical protein EYF80_037042 [Liparis tanakae]